MADLKKIKAWILVLHYVSLFTPIYRATFWGTELEFNVRDLNAGTTFIIVFGISLLVSLFVIYFRKSWDKFMKYIQLGLMGILVILLLIAKADNETFGFSIMLQGLFTALYALSLFLPELLQKVFGKINEYRLKLVELLEKLDSKLEDKELQMKQKKESSSEFQEEITVGDEEEMKKTDITEQVSE